MTKDEWLNDYIGAFNRGDFATFTAFYDENVVLHLGGKRTIHGRQGIVDFYTDVFKRIEEIRRTGIARTREEHTPGIMGVGRAAIVGGVALGAFSIAMPLARFSPDVEKKAIDLLVRATHLLSQGGEGVPE